MASTWISEFDHRYTAPDGGYASGADYYNRAGACHVLDSIAVPTLIITAQDDPFIPYSMFTVPPIQRHSKIRVIAPRHGGHCGFFHWAQQRRRSFLGGESDYGFLARAKVKKVRAGQPDQAV